MSENAKNEGDVEQKVAHGPGRVSQQKLNANRRNALKSTGPKTRRGKAYSARNAIKHGLFSRSETNFLSQDENPAEYEKLLNGLYDQYQPIGKAEELEVERLAIYWWKFKRAWRYENATNVVALRNFGRRELAEQTEWCKERDKREEAIIAELQNVSKELRDSGEVSEKFNERILAIGPEMEHVWKLVERRAQSSQADPKIARMFREASPEERSWGVALCRVTLAIGFLKQLAQQRAVTVHEIAVAQHVIPNAEVLDKLLRYEAAIERQLNRAADRLERLQRRRRGEMVPPPLSVHLTR